jgi:two-component system, OmpR family, response regulator RstA
MDALGRVLVVEDDSKLARLVAEFLTANGFLVTVEERGDRAVERILAEAPDAVILDLMLPGKDGLSVCREVRRDYRGAVLMLTARGDDLDEIVGLEVGADDYMAKPVRPRVLLARLKSLLRRTSTPAEERRVVLGALVLDASNRTAVYRGAPLDLTTAEFELLWYLGNHAGDVVEREQLYVDVRGVPWDGVDRSIDLRVSRLRKKLGDTEKPPQLLKSVRGTGYLLVREP